MKEAELFRNKGSCYHINVPANEKGKLKKPKKKKSKVVSQPL